MAETFNPYHKWLGISPKDQPPNYYRLLAIELFESDADVIEGAADQRMAHVRTFQTGQNSALSQRILNELSAAKLCLLDPQKKAEYDRQLQAKTSPPAPPRGVANAGAQPPLQPLPIEAPAVPAFSVPDSPVSVARVRAARSKPAWQQPAVLAGIAAAILVCGAAIYFLSAGPQPKAVQARASRPAASKKSVPSAPASKRREPTPVQAAVSPDKTTAPLQQPEIVEPVGADSGDIDADPTAGDKSMPELAPPAPAASEQLPRPEPNKPIDVLAAIDLDRDLPNSRWRLDGSSLVSSEGDHSAVQLPVVVPDDYRLDIVAAREAGDDCISFTLPVGGAQTSLIIDGYEGKLSGLQTIDGKHIDVNETRREGTRFADGRPKLISIIVRNNRVQMTCDGQELVDWTGDVSRLGPSSNLKNLPYKDRIYLGHWYSRYRISKIELTPLSAEAPSVPVGSREVVDKNGDRRRNWGDLASGKHVLQPPDEAAQKKSREEIQKTFGVELAGAKTPAAKRNLAQRLIEQAAKTPDDATARYVLLRQAADLAGEAGDVDLAWKAVDELASEFAVDLFSFKQEALTTAGKAAKSPRQFRELAERDCELLTASLAVGDATATKKIALQAQGFAKRTKDRVSVKVIANRTRDAGKLAAEFEDVAAARKTLETAPDDAKANLKAGQYAVRVQGDWGTALPMIAKGSASPWQKAAADELALAEATPTPQETAALADGWWALAEKERWPGRHYVRMHAAEWYRRALPLLAGAAREQPQSRLVEMLADDDGLPIWEILDMSGSQKLDDFVRLTPGTRLRTPVDYDGPIEVSFVARTDGLNIRLWSYNRETVVWNWETDPTELRVAAPSGAQSSGKVSPLEPNRWYALRYLATRQGTTVFVDGAPIFSQPRVNNRFPASIVGVNGAVGSIVDVKKFVVKPLE